MALILQNQSLVLQAYAVLVGQQPGYTALNDHLTFIATNSVPAYSAQLNTIFLNTSTATLAATMITNLGLTGIVSQADAEAYLNSSPNHVEAMINLSNTLYTYAGTDASILAAQTAYKTSIDTSYAYSIVTTNTASVSLTPGAGTTFPLTTGLDIIAGTPGNDTISGIFNGAAGTNTFTPGDSINGGGGSDLLTVVDQGASGTGALPSATTVANIQDVKVISSEAVTVAATTANGWTNIGTLTVTSAATGANADTVTANAGTNVVVTDTAKASTSDLKVDGGTTVTVTQTNTDNAAANVLGSIAIGGTTSPAGAITVTSTDTLDALAATASASGNIVVKGGTDVTITSSVTGATATNAAAALVGGVAPAAAANTAANIVVSGATGNVTVNSATINNSLVVDTIEGDAITITGGKTVTVTQTVGTTQSATAVSTINQGAVSVTGDATTTTVSVTQAAAATGALASAAAAAVTGKSAVTAVKAAAGVEAVAGVTAVNGGNSVLASAAVVGTPTVTTGAVAIADKVNTSTATSTITTVTLANYGASTFAGSALQTLNLSGTAGTLAITNGAAAAATNTALALNLNGLSGTNTITDVNGEIKTLNVTTSTKDSSITNIIDTGLTTLNVSGTNVLTLGSGATAGDVLNGNADNTNLATIAVSGSAGFSADVSALGAALTSFTTTSSGKITATLDAANQTFVGSTGQDVITIKVNAAKTITGGSGTTDQLILANTVAAAGNAAAIYTAAGMAKITGFESLGINNSTATNVSTYDMKNVFSGFSTVELISANSGKQTITNAADGTKLLIDKAQTSVEFDLFNASTTGVADVSVNTTSATTGITVGTLTLNDSNGDGIATLNLTSNNKTAAPAGGTGITNTITTLADTSLSALNITGNASLAIGTLSLGQPSLAVPVGVASLTIGDNTTAFSNTGSTKVAGTITTLVDDTLGSLSFTGSNNFTIGTLIDANAVNLTISNTGTGTDTITKLIADANTNKAITNGLSNITFTGTGNTTIGQINYVTNSADLTFTNSGTGVVTISALDEATTVANVLAGTLTGSLATTTKITLSGNIGLGVAGTTVGGDTPVVLASTAGVTFAAGTDNAHISLQLAGAAAGKTDTITVGNANNYIVDGSSAGTVAITVGTGYNYIDVSAGGNNATYSASVTLGAHTDTTTAYDKILVSAIGSQVSGFSNSITGTAAGDVIIVKDSGADTVYTALNSAQQQAIAADTTLAAAIADAFTAIAGTAHNATSFQWNGNTYIVEDADGAGATAGTDTVVKIVGLHTVADFGTVSGGLTIAS